MRKVSVFGSTGCIGQKTVRMIANDLQNYEVEVLTAYENVSVLAEQARLVNAKNVVIAGRADLSLVYNLFSGTRTKIHFGRSGLIAAASFPTDWAMVAITGVAGLEIVMQLINIATPIIALANKESVVCGGRLLLDCAAEKNVKIIPVDSEHSAIFQILENGKPINEINYITLTASGGPLLNSTQKMETVTPDAALAHPVWKMGSKISIDSATMVNKVLEVIEAYYLFSLSETRIRVLIHPESIVHGMVSYHDGSTIAVMSPPDMNIPISYSLSWPRRMVSSQQLDLTKYGNLSFFEPDVHKFPCFKLAMEVLQSSNVQHSSILINAANEYSVDAFLTKKILFTDIYKIISETLNGCHVCSISSIEEVIECHNKGYDFARQIAKRLVDERSAVF